MNKNNEKETQNWKESKVKQDRVHEILFLVGLDAGRKYDCFAEKEKLYHILV